MFEINDRVVVKEKLRLEICSVDTLKIKFFDIPEGAIGTIRRIIFKIDKNRSGILIVNFDKFYNGRNKFILEESMLADYSPKLNNYWLKNKK